MSWKIHPTFPVFVLFMFSNHIFVLQNALQWDRILVLRRAYHALGIFSYLGYLPYSDMKMSVSNLFR